MASDQGSANEASNLIPFIPQAVAEILLWSNIVHSAVIFCVGLVFFWLILIGQYTFLQLVSLILCLHLGICLLYINGSIILFPSKDGAVKACGVPETAVLIPPETIDSILRQALHSFNAAAVFVYNVYHCRNNALTVQVLIGLVVFNIISRLFSDVQILFIVFLAAFSVPKYYVLNRAICDAWLNAAHKRIERVSNQASEFMRSHIPAMAARAEARQMLEKQERSKSKSQ